MKEVPRFAKIATTFVLLLIYLAYPAQTLAQGEKGENAKWFGDQKDASGDSCCGKGDAPPVQVNKLDGFYEFIWDGRAWKIPPEKIEFVEDTPRHASVIFFSYTPADSMTVYCAKLIRPRI